MFFRRSNYWVAKTPWTLQSVYYFIFHKSVTSTWLRGSLCIPMPSKCLVGIQ